MMMMMMMMNDDDDNDNDGIIYDATVDDDGLYNDETIMRMIMNSVETKNKMYCPF